MKKITQNLDIVGGTLLIACSIITIIFANLSPTAYVEFNNFQLFWGLDVKHFVNDVLMTLFFFMIGLEVVREVTDGALSSKDKILLPLLTAASGFAVPALIFVLIVGFNSDAIAGWAIPTATDIAFALGIIALLGDRVNTNLKILLMAIAVIDDLLAIATIAIFYTADLQAQYLLVSLVSCVTLFTLMRNKVEVLTPYLASGVILWLSMYFAGVHATLAGVITAMFIPRGNKGFSHNKEHKLHLLVTLLIIPIFAVCNAGVEISPDSSGSYLDATSIAVATALILGKPLGIYTTAYLTVRYGVCKLPEGVTLSMVGGISILCSIGFTMSIYIGSLAGLPTDSYKVGILLAAAFASLLGILVLSKTNR
ncbi:Na(+)/H(+) antiporter NhaA [Vibrio chagasii]|nr:Na(+)/H(+) antiporter NhaA [Vibrio chagasii]